MLFDPGKFAICFLSLIVAVCTFVSCGGKNSAGIEPKSNKLSSPDFFKGNPGKNRIRLFWGMPDSRADQAVIYWNNNSDSLVVPVQESSDTMSVTLKDLSEGNQSFGIVLRNNDGRISARSKLVAKIYGDTYQASLSPRKIGNTSFTSGKVDIHWEASAPKMLATEVKYLQQSGQSRQIQVEPNINKSFLNNFKSGSAFKYRTAYLPEPQAIDTFYSNYALSDTLATIHTFTNPLLDRGADPWVIQKNGTYYYTHTTGNRIVLYATDKMSELAEARVVTVWRPPANTDYSHDIWAPELHFINHKWYIYFAADDGKDVNHRMYAIENSADNPLKGDWQFKGKVTHSGEWAIDGTTLEYNGQLYMIWSGKVNGTFPQNLYISKMRNPWTLESSRVKISSPVYAWEKNGAPINEGPEILKNSKRDIFLVYSGSGFWTDDYSLGMLSLKDGGNPLNYADWFKKSNPVFTRNDQAGAYGPGHCSFFKSPDGTEDWILYHARSRPGGGSTNHRNPRMQKFSWKKSGTPNFGKPVKIDTKIPVPSGEYKK